MARGREAKDDGIKVIATHRKARHQYDILETFEAGMVLLGTEVKALRDNRCDLSGAFAVLDGEEVFIKGMEIGEYVQANRQNHEPRRKRKLLLHRREIRKLKTKIRERGFTLVPLRVYFKASLAKIEIAVAKGRKTHDRREATAKREAQREMARAVGRRR